MIKTDKVIYHAGTEGEYYWLMEQLEEADCYWARTFALPTEQDYWHHSSDKCVRLEKKGISGVNRSEHETGRYSYYEFIEVSDIMHPYKDTADKPKLSLVPPQIMFDIAEVREYGNKKYPEGGKDNWKKVDIDDYKDALLRHTLKYLQDPKGKDEESGIEHYKHMACNIAFICEMEAKNV